MYKHIIVATDGSNIAGKAVSHGVDLAKALGSKLSAVTVTEPYDPVVANESHGDYNERSAEIAGDILSVVTSAAQAAGVECDDILVENRAPYEGVIEAAEKVGADLIVLGSHGRRGIEGLLIGSQANKLLTHTKIPALVVR